jgi:hypothetical protein
MGGGSSMTETMAEESIGSSERRISSVTSSMAGASSASSGCDVISRSSIASPAVGAMDTGPAAGGWDVPPAGGFCAIHSASSAAPRARTRARSSSWASPADWAARRNHTMASTRSLRFHRASAVWSAHATSSSSVSSGGGMPAMAGLLVITVTRREAG